VIPGTNPQPVSALTIAMPTACSPTTFRIRRNFLGHADLAGAGRAVAIILVNADDKPHAVTLPFETADHGLKGRLATREWIATEKPAPRPEARPAAASWSREITMDPLAAMAVEIEMDE
jgi:hypothetical protein